MNYVENIRRYYQSIIGHVDKRDHKQVETNTDDLLVIHSEEIPESAAQSTGEQGIEQE
ncbi:transglycosylase [Vibrio sp. JCM 19236]|nr:transglycosylase [Vibrio sp. JCM 19236]